MLPSVYRILLLTLLFVSAAQAGSVHDIHLYTDSSPDFVSVDDFVATATSAWDDPEDQAIALWRWVVRSRQQITPTREDGVPLWDAIQFLGSYPNTNCGYVASFLTAFAEAMGGDWRHRYIELSDHTVCELSWDAGATWHMFDTSMVVFARRHDGQIAACADIAEAQSCALSSFWGDPGAEAGHLYIYHATPEAMTNPPDGLQLLFASVHIDFIRQAHYPGVVEIATAINRVGNSSWGVFQAGFQDGECFALTEAAMVKAVHGRPEPLTDRERELMQQLLFRQ